MVEEQLQVGARAALFIICPPEIDTTKLSSLQRFLSSANVILHKLHQRLLI
jgi:hypothetical protein